MMERIGRFFKVFGRDWPATTWGGLLPMTWILIIFCIPGSLGLAAREQFAEPAATAEQQQLDQMEQQADEQPPAAEKKPPVESLIDYLPADDSPVYDISQIQIQGNQVLTVHQLLKHIPAVFDATGKYRIPPEPSALYDLRPFQALVVEPAASRSISARTIQGFTQYLLSVYQQHHYAGIYVYVPTEAFAPDGTLRQGILPIRVRETPVLEVSSRTYDPNNQPAAETYLWPGIVEKWSPVQPGQVLQQKKLNEYLNVMNLNPDRYVAAIVGRAAEPNALSVRYNIYEASPWHWFLQVDNSGTDDRRWAPRIGLIHTDVLGVDDRFTVIYQAKPQRNIEDEFSVYGSYDLPLFSPWLRVKLFGAYSEYDTQGLGTFNFLGRGYHYGTQLRIHALQHRDWFFDVTGSVIQEESRTTPLLVTSDVRMDMWGVGSELYKTEDRAESFFSVNVLKSFETTGDFLNVRGSGAADEDFTIYSTTARHSRYLDPQKVHRLSASFTWTGSDGRLVPSRMTAFGGMYTVRGYDEYEIVADGGILTSMQYEYDIVKAEQANYGSDQSGTPEARPFLRKLAPVVFVDYGQARIEDALPFEQTDRELCSVGGGLITEMGDNVTGIVYAGYPLIETDDTREGKGRLHAGVLIRW